MRESRPRTRRDHRVPQSYHTLRLDSFTPHLFSLNDDAAAKHLFRVAAGLDSLVVGEPQILGQVKEAFETAAGRLYGADAEQAVHWSFGVGKRVRSETALGEGAVSISFAAPLARKIFGRLEGRRVLVIGAGEISTLTAEHLRAQGVGEITIISRTAVTPKRSPRPSAVGRRAGTTSEHCSTVPTSSSPQPDRSVRS